MPPRFRTLKTVLRKQLESSDWENTLKALDELPPAEVVSPLIACLPLGGEVTSRAARGLGRVVAHMADTNLESARNVVRRLMWHMNEESGNIGWGIPEAFGEVLAGNRKLAELFGPVLISYITDTGKEDNYCDHDVLRRSCYDGVARFLNAWPDFAEKARGPLQAGLHDPDSVCREKARALLEKIGLLPEMYSPEGL